MLYTPLLPGAAGGTLEPRHVVVPLREQLKRTHLKLARVTGADPSRKQVTIRSPEGREETLTYDQLVVTIGSTSRTLPIPGLAEHAVGFKTLSEAIALRNRLVQTLEHAESIDDDEARHSLLTYVFVGAGYAGVEGLAELQDFAADVLELYPRCRLHGVRFVLVEARDRLMPEISESLADVRGRRAAPPRDRDPARHDDRARLGRLDRALHRRGDPDPHGRLDRGRQAAPDRRRARACRSTTAAGSRSTATARSRASTTSGRSATPPRCPDPARPGQPSPPTCQHAIRQGRTVGANVAAALGAGAQEAVHATRRSACSWTWAATRPSPRRSGSRWRGFPAWFLARSYHLTDDAGRPPPRAARGRLDRRAAVRARLVRAGPARPPAAARGRRARASRARAGRRPTARAAPRTRTCVERRRARAGARLRGRARALERPARRRRRHPRHDGGDARRGRGAVRARWPR